MARRALVAAIILLATCGCALADFSCVQQELARLGLDPGPVDGALGRKTRGALATYRRAAPYLSEVPIEAADRWCAALLEAIPFELGMLAIDGTSASSGTLVSNAMSVTPIWGKTPEYQVPAWVNRSR